MFIFTAYVPLSYIWGIIAALATQPHHHAIASAFYLSLFLLSMEDFTFTKHICQRSIVRLTVMGKSYAAEILFLRVFQKEKYGQLCVHFGFQASIFCEI